MVSTLRIPSASHATSGPDLPPRWASSAYLVGIAGSGMKALAELLAGLGWNVRGSDPGLTTELAESFRKAGVRVAGDHREEHVPEEVDLLVYSPAVTEENPERRAAERLGIPQLSYSKMLGWLMRDRTGVSIAGTHGKTTTTAMVARILTEGGFSPSAVIGAELCGRGVSGWAGEGELFVVESCEYRRHFLDLTPTHAAILGIETDHFDCFPDLAATREAFRDFADKLPADGVLMVRGDCATSRQAIATTSAQVETFSLHDDSDWWATDIRTTSEGTRFRAFHRGQFFSELSLRLYGQHNVLNALAAAALSFRIGASARDIRECLREFRGMRRRFEMMGTWRGVTLIDDYAHHPTAVATTLAAARGRFGNRRILCLFQPHQISRTRNLLAEFGASFSAADRVFVAPVFAAREQGGEICQNLSGELAQRISAHGQNAAVVSLDRIVTTLEDESRPGDVVITMGAGDIYQVHHEFHRRLQRDYAAR